MHSNMIDNQVVSRIAQKIRSVRLERNLTIQQLATRMNVSKGLISKIENSKTIPSLPVFIMIVQSLDIPLKEFFQDVVLVTGNPYLVVRKNRYSVPELQSSKGLRYHRILSQNVQTCAMEIVQLTMEPGTKEKATAINGYSFKYILAGECECQITNEIFMLGEGDAIYLDASQLHILSNKAAIKLVVLSIHFILAER